VFGRVSDDKDWIDFSTGYSYNVLLNADKSLWYDLKSNGMTGQFAPVKVVGTGKWSSFSTYNRHVLEIMSDGSL
jgi:hypothetical protein